MKHLLYSRFVYSATAVEALMHSREITLRPDLTEKGRRG
jgi:hypothetical protein